MPDMFIDVDAAVALLVNKVPLMDDTDFKTREVAITYDQAGMDLVWNFTTSAGAVTQTAVTPTTGGNYPWTNVGDAMYKIGMPASGGASINNDTEGYGFFTGICTGVLAWVSPIYGFRAAGLNDLLTDSAYSATRGLSGTALPAAAANAAGGLPISTAGALDLDAQIKTDIDAILSDTGTDGVVLAADAITSAKIADDAISSEHLNTGAFTADAFAANALIAATFAADCITAAKVAADVSTEIVTAIFAKTGITAGGVVTFSNLLKALYAGIRGKVAKSADTYAFKDDDDSTTVFTHTVDSDGRTVA